MKEIKSYCKFCGDFIPEPIKDPKTGIIIPTLTNRYLNGRIIHCQKPKCEVQFKKLTKKNG